MQMNIQIGRRAETLDECDRASVGSAKFKARPLDQKAGILKNTFSIQRLGLAAAIVAEGSLSFLGLGVEPPKPSWAQC